MNRQMIFVVLLSLMCTASSFAQQASDSDIALNSVERPPASPPAVREGLYAGERQQLAAEMAFRWCPPTQEPFRMGRQGATDDDAPVFVTLSKGFWLGETEVTQQQWSAIMRSKPWRDKDHVMEGPDFAASCIRHGCASDGTVATDSALDFCQRLTELEHHSGRLPADWKYTLPTEAQWEYACRAGSNSLFHFGDDVTRLNDYAWHKQNSYFIGEYYAHRVGLKKPNAWGFHDMHGNVWEWCLDWYHEKLPGGRDPVVLTAGSYRIRRGGSWNDYASGCSSATRVRFAQSVGVGTYGFRVAVVQTNN